MIEYLRQPIDDQQSIQQYSIVLNKNLIEAYGNQCQRKWFAHPHDDYYYEYLIFHATQAKDNDIIQEIINDFKWMLIKIQLDKTTYNLRRDLEKVIDYLKENDIEVYRISVTM